MDKEWWAERGKGNSVAKRFRKKALANQELLERLFSGTRIGVQDGWSVGSGPDVYRPQHGYDNDMEFQTNTSNQAEDFGG
ncbi:unnamed protein product [Arabis nemorensis]|uniref:Uncharacterized protein n=1 Tax=Arabis nemorensis TaxID=586526 RepID=A0A565AYH8_9BRAS|nr:unnamed protein product [Arabis nemorensis]